MAKPLLIAGMLLITGLRIFTSLAAKGGFGNKWQLWMLGEPRFRESVYSTAVPPARALLV
jgi:hypothetical protein